MAITNQSKRGSVLLTTLFFITLISVVAWGVYDLAMNAYRLSQRNEYLARAKSIADSELDYIYFRIETAMMEGAQASGVPSALADICDIPATPTTPNQTCTPTNVERTPFCLAFQNTPENWKIGRSISWDFSAYGIKDHKTSNYSYFTVRVQVASTGSPAGPIVVRVGRRMNNAVNSIFQYNIFAQGDLEFAPGGNVVVNGDIAANGGIYMGSQNNAGSTLQVNAYVRHLTGSVFNTSELANGTTIKPPTFGTSQAAQENFMDQPENLLGGLSASDIAAKFGIDHTFTAGGDSVDNPDYNALFGTITVDRSNTPDPLQLATAENRVYRSVITPPPEAVADAAISHGADFRAEYPDVASASALSTSVTDDPGVQALRAYNRAGLVMTVYPDGTSKFEARQTDGTLTNVSTDFSSVSGLVTSTLMYDLRESKDIAITEIDVGKLKTTLEGSPTYAANFNGLLYVYLSNSSETHPAAVRLVNGAATPVSAYEHGFSVATNGGIYVKGSYNTVTLGTDSDGNEIHNPAMLMADAVTVLSSAWDDSVVTAQSGDSAAVIAAKHTPEDTIASRVAAAETTIVGAGILTGNITADAYGNYIYSGGGHNLVRFLEKWSDSSVEFYGSIGRLFESTHFTGIFRSPSYDPYKYVYDTPAHRAFTFNDSLKKKSPYGAPSVTVFDRGTIFTW